MFENITIKDIGIIIALISSVGGWIGTFVIRLNDLKHLKKFVKCEFEKIDKRLQNLEDKTFDQEGEIKYLKGKVNGG